MDKENAIFKSGTRSDLPLHTFDMVTGHGIPFSVSAIDSACDQINAGYPHRHTFCQILLVDEGEGVHYIDFAPVQFSGRMLFFISPGQIHFWKMNRALAGTALLFTEDFLVSPGSKEKYIYENSFFFNSFPQSYLSLNGEQYDAIKALFDSIREEFSGDEDDRISVLCSYLQLLTIKIKRFLKQTGVRHSEQSGTAVYRHFLHLVCKLYYNEHSIARYAEILGITSGHLSSLVKKETGYTPKQIISKEVCLEAKRLLTHTGLTAAEIGYKLNFDDPSYFARFFKRETGISPSQFKEEIREIYKTG